MTSGCTFEKKPRADGARWGQQPCAHLLLARHRRGFGPRTSCSCRHPTHLTAVFLLGNTLPEALVRRGGGAHHGRPMACRGELGRRWSRVSHCCGRRGSDAWWGVTSAAARVCLQASLDEARGRVNRADYRAVTALQYPNSGHQQRIKSRRIATSPRAISHCAQLTWAWKESRPGNAHHRQNHSTLSQREPPSSTNQRPPSVVEDRH